MIIGCQHSLGELSVSQLDLFDWFHLEIELNSISGKS